MINAMPILINSLFPFAAKSVDSEAKTLIETARQIFAAAETEAKLGDLANNMIKPGEVKGNLVEIAAWHYQRGAQNYREAMSRFERAGKYGLPSKYAKYVEKKKSECAARANAALSKKQAAEKMLGQ